MLDAGYNFVVFGNYVSHQQHLRHGQTNLQIFVL